MVITWPLINDMSVSTHMVIMWSVSHDMSVSTHMVITWSLLSQIFTVSKHCLSMYSEVLVSSATLASGHSHIYTSTCLFIWEGVWQTVGHRWKGKHCQKRDKFLFVLRRCPYIISQCSRTHRTVALGWFDHLYWFDSLFKNGGC